MGANILLFLCSNILGAIDFYIADRKQRRSVLETRQSLEVKITLESENLQQVCVLFVVFQWEPRLKNTFSFKVYLMVLFNWSLRF